jgi:hypothetical protein
MFRDFYSYSCEALLLGGGALQVLTTQIDTDADFAVLQQVATAIDRRAHVQQVETSSGRMIHDVQNLPLCNVFGTGRFPYRLPVALILNLGTLFNTQVTDESGAGNQIRFAYHGVKLFQTAPYTLPTYTDKRLFTYSANFVAAGVDPTGLGAIPAGGRADYSLRIQPDADFEWDKIAITYDLAIPAATDTIATVQIRDESLGRYFSDRPIPVESFSGCRIADVLGPAGFNPYVLPQPKIFKAGTLITLTVRNQDPANALGIRFSFMGKKCYA